MNAFALTLAMLALVSPTVLAGQEMYILTYDKARSQQCGEQSLAFVTGNVFESARDATLDPTNFGPDGVVPREVVFLEPVSKLTRSALVGVDVVMINPQEGGHPMDRCEILALRDFVEHGGGVFAFYIPAMIQLKDLIGCYHKFDCYYPYGIFNDVGHPIIDGPFGHLGGVLFTSNHCSVWDINLCGGVEILRSNNGGAMAGAFQIGSGHAFIINNASWVMSKEGCNQAPYWGELSKQLLLNALAWIAPAENFYYNPQQLECYADCDQNCELNLFDYLCFTNRFNAGSESADCDQSGSLDLFDFLCFVNDFNAGCY